jgi:hypothetical protein
MTYVESALQSLVDSCRANGYEEFAPHAVFREFDGAIATIGFVRDKWESPERSAISCHLGVTSRSLSELYGPTYEARFPEPFAQHWYRWSGFISERERRDSDWRVREDHADDLREANADLVERVLPAVERRGGDRGLADDWAASEDAWLPPAIRLVYVATLCKVLGDVECQREFESRLDEMIDPAGWSTPGLASVRSGLVRSGLDVRIVRG